MIKLYGGLASFLQAPTLHPHRLRGGRVPPISIIEIKCYDSPAPLPKAEAREFKLGPNISASPYSTQSSNANANGGNGDTAIFIHCFDKKGLTYFTVCSVEEDGTISPKYSISPPSPLRGHDCVFLGATCNGLFHFLRLDWDHLLWNSKTNEIKTLPRSFSSESNPSEFLDAFALCCSSFQQDYKLLHYLKTYTLDEQGRFEDFSHHFWLYSLKTNSWKTIVPCTEFTSVGGGSVCINEVFYCKAWSPDKNDKDEEAQVILSFDFSTETLSYLPLPPDTVGTDNYCILDYKGLLSVAVYDCLEKEPSKYVVWVMVGGLWTRESVFHIHGVHHPVWFSKNGQLLYFEGIDSQVVVYDRGVGKFKNLGCHSYHSPLAFYRM